MRLCFVGDIAVEHVKTQPQLHFSDCDVVIGNLEGPLLQDGDSRILQDSKEPIPIYNTYEVFDVIRAFNITGLCLANNHIYDLPLPISYTQSQLAKHSIGSFGAGTSRIDANKPLTYHSISTTIHIFGYGWNVIGCKILEGEREGVNPFSPYYMLDNIRDLRKTDSESCVIYYLHWNYELEIYPQPAHRQLAYALIDAGVDVVIGLHPHVVQGVEIYKDKPIVYSLGNWFFPPREIGQFNLRFPKITSRQLALKMDVTGRQISELTFQWYQFDMTDHTIKPESSEKNISEPIVSALTPFHGLSHNDYCTWFIDHRKRKRGLPVYLDYRHTRLNYLRDRYILTRQNIVRRLVKLGLKRGLST